MGQVKCKTPACDNLQRWANGRAKDTLCTSCAGKRQRMGTVLRFPKTYPSMRINDVWLSAQGYPETRFAGIQVLVHRLVDSLTHGPLPVGFEVHHKDENKTNPHWLNLKRMTKEEHSKYHGTRRWDK